MGPQLDSCGRFLWFGADRTHTLLQWGRNLIVAEGPPSQTPGFVGRRALQWGRNLIVAEGRFGMRPFTFWRVLQWGRNLIVAEGSREHGNVPEILSASMGPQLDSCGRVSLKRRHRPTPRFNGAAT